MLGAPYRSNYWNWPGVGEIDIMENRNGENTWIGAFHCGINPGGPGNEPNGRSSSASGFAPTLQAGFHVHRLEFDKFRSLPELRWYVDGIRQYTLRSSQLNDEAAWKAATSHGCFIILDVAIGGGLPGVPTSNTASGGTMKVGYVRVYTRP